MIARQENELSPSIVRTVADTEGSRILAHPEEAGTPWLQGALVNLAVLYEAVHTTSHILDLDQLLEKIMDLIFKTIEADRGCVMLRHPESTVLEPKAPARRQSHRPDEKKNISRTIMDHVLRNREGVIVSDAAHDERFNSGAKHRPIRHSRSHLCAYERPARDPWRPLSRYLDSTARDA